MAQDFERYGLNAVGTSAVTVHTSNSDDAIISVRLANITTSTINADVFITSSVTGGSQNHYLIKNAPIVAGGSLELIDGGSKIVLESGDVVKAQSDTASSLSVWMSVVDAIST
jgi:hypothetical protein|tara:strand:+ start:440 stop:778 length:339 start_codon:yes stop_codon:yes gene_type:complete